MKLASLFLVVLATTPSAQELFPTARLVADAVGGEFRGNGDFDADGDVDLIHYSQTGFTWTGVTIFRNDGAGEFTPGNYLPFAFPTSYSVGTLRPEVGDFDGDGNLDFAINRDGSGVAIGEGIEFFLGDGAGEIASRVLHPMTTPRWIKVGNVDSDAADEIVVTWGDASFNTWIGWVDFQGGSPVRLPATAVNTALIPWPLLFDVVDVNGDGFDDVAATSPMNSGSPSIFFLESVSGVLSLGSQFSVPLPMQNVNHRLCAGDLDGDGDEDLLLLKMEPGDSGPWVQVLERTTTGWTQRTEQQVPRPSAGWIQPHYIQLADWNSDGWLDVVTCSATTDVLEAKGDWTFSEGFQTDGTGQRAGGGAFDANGDGVTDCVSGIAMLVGDGLFERAGTVPMVLGLGLGPLPTNYVDYEGDGDLDLLGDLNGSLRVNDGTGSFTVGGIGGYSAPPTPWDWLTPLAFADFDGNGYYEYLFSYGEIISFFQLNTVGISRLEQDGKGGYLPATEATAPGDLIAPPSPVSTSPLWATGDVDNDGDLDLLIVDGYRENDGTGFFGAVVPAWLGRGRMAQDLDGNGISDIVVTRDVGASTSIEVYFDLGPGTTIGTFDASDATVAARDLDGDQDLDLVVGKEGAAGLRLFENTGSGFSPTFIELPDALLPTPGKIGIDDGDGDGVNDLFLVKQLPNSQFVLEILRGTAGTFAFTPWRAHLVPYAFDSFRDIDSDGDLDAVGVSLMRGTRTVGLEGGAIRQTETGVVGSDNYFPVLGASGPAVSSTSTDTLRIVNGLGGSSFVLVFGTQPTLQVDQPIAGLTLFVANPIAFPLFPLGGVAGLAGDGSISFPMPNLPGIAGVTIHHQAFIMDPSAPSGWSATNRLSVVYGL